MAHFNTADFNLILNCSRLRRTTCRIAMDDAYDYTVLQDDDPEELHSRLQDQISIAELEYPGSEECPAPQRKEALISMIHGSNMIESAGGGFDITHKLCQMVFDDASIPEMTQDDPCYLTLKTDREKMGLSSDRAAIFRSRHEIIQHALAARYIYTEVLRQQDLSEEIILETHRILTHKIDAEDIPWTQYSGVYRRWPVSTGFHTYMHHVLVPAAMRKMMRSYRDDVATARCHNQVDPVALAAKYCHALVNIHPFLDGNGRLCRLVLNVILLQLGGVFAPFGAEEEDRDEYLAIAARASLLEGSQEDMEGVDDGLRPKHYRELASFTLRRVLKYLEHTQRG